jgi:hypothetical protein
MVGHGQASQLGRAGGVWGCPVGQTIATFLLMSAWGGFVVGGMWDVVVDGGYWTAGEGRAWRAC